jgi:hypothetical protein
MVTLVIRHSVARTVEQQVRLLQRTVQLLKLEQESGRASRFFRVGIHHCHTDFLMVTCEIFNKHGDPLLTFIWSAMGEKKNLHDAES